MLKKQTSCRPDMGKPGGPGTAPGWKMSLSREVGSGQPAGLKPIASRKDIYPAVALRRWEEGTEARSGDSGPRTSDLGPRILDMINRIGRIKSCESFKSCQRFWPI